MYFPDDPDSLELDEATMRQMGAAVLDRVIGHLVAIDDAPGCGDLDAQALCRALRAPAPQEPEALDAILEPYFEQWVPRSYTAPSPRCFGFVPGGGLFPSALADLIADATNRFTGIWWAAPALVQLEANVLDWFAEWMGLPSTTRGALTTGGSLAHLHAIVAAREKLLGDALRDGVLYVSAQAHHSAAKAARIAGIRDDRIRVVPVDAQFRLRTDALATAIDADRQAGLRPFLVVSSAGTTNTGTIDPIAEVTSITAANGMWHHVDGAYGAFFRLVDEMRGPLEALAGVDSITLDPHKGLFLPYGTGAVLVADGAALRAAHAASAVYLPDAPDEEFYDPSQYSPELSRDFRGLRVWLPLQLYGLNRFRRALAEKRRLSVAAAARLAKSPNVVMVAPPELSLFAFHLTWPGATEAQENERTKAVLDDIVARGRFLITGCTVDGRYLARVCVLVFRSRQRHVDELVDEILATTQRLL